MFIEVREIVWEFKWNFKEIGIDNRVRIINWENNERALGKILIKKNTK